MKELRMDQCSHQELHWAHIGGPEILQSANKLAPTRPELVTRWILRMGAVSFGTNGWLTVVTLTPPISIAEKTTNGVS